VKLIAISRKIKIKKYIYGVKDCNMNIQSKFFLFASISAALLFSLGRRQRKTNTHRHVHSHAHLSPSLNVVTTSSVEKGQLSIPATERV
jgi:hypothetical protein